jgi:hypothetical protein
MTISLREPDITQELQIQINKLIAYSDNKTYYPINPFYLSKQNKNHWCWAAVTQSVIARHLGFFLSQSAISTLLFGHVSNQTITYPILVVLLRAFGLNTISCPSHNDASLYITLNNLTHTTMSLLVSVTDRGGHLILLKGLGNGDVLVGDPASLADNMSLLKPEQLRQHFSTRQGKKWQVVGLILVGGLYKHKWIEPPQPMLTRSITHSLYQEMKNSYPETNFAIPDNAAMKSYKRMVRKHLFKPITGSDAPYLTLLDHHDCNTPAASIHDLHQNIQVYCSRFFSIQNAFYPLMGKVLEKATSSKHNLGNEKSLAFNQIPSQDSKYGADRTLA